MKRTINPWVGNGKRLAAYSSTTFIRFSGLNRKRRSGAVTFGSRISGVFHFDLVAERVRRRSIMKLNGS